MRFFLISLLFCFALACPPHGYEYISALMGRDFNVPIVLSGTTYQFYFSLCQALIKPLDNPCQRNAPGPVSGCLVWGVGTSANAYFGIVGSESFEG